MSVTMLDTGSALHALSNPADGSLFARIDCRSNRLETIIGASMKSYRVHPVVLMTWPREAVTTRGGNEWEQK